MAGLVNSQRSTGNDLPHKGPRSLWNLLLLFEWLLSVGDDIVQCKGNLVPHESPKGIACCDDVDLCNEHIEPTVVYRSTTFMPGGTLDFFSPHICIT